ncbi:hypothetical protein FZ041_13315 [Selenomonas caprae]|uniref:Uncharacterized protein n=1 Tax=Selenomonas caprae TaxID=2606905 RepID=A0A5D6WFG0_9FIRM|nr:hypothetical protein [Selenomonas caprae]TYZ26823.1 hypothetical protein FZ041_13315 [Selenomonas caprae]
MRKVADGVDWVTDQGQEFCRNRKVSCEKRQKELMDKLEAMSQTQYTEEELKDMEKMAKEMMAEIKDLTNDAKKDIEDAEFTEVKAEESKKESEEPKATLKSAPILA